VERCGRSSTSPHLDNSLAPPVRRSDCAHSDLGQKVPCASPSSCCALPSPLELAGSVRLQRLVGTCPTVCDRRWSSRFSRDERTKEELTHKKAISLQSHLPLSRSGGLGAVVHFQKPISLLPLFASNAGEVPICIYIMDAMKNALEPFGLRGASRCASRGETQHPLGRFHEHDQERASTRSRKRRCEEPSSIDRQTVWSSGLG